jgi:hypothetical protein
MRPKVVTTANISGMPQISPVVRVTFTVPPFRAICEAASQYRFVR